MTRQLENALELARKGVRVFPAHGITDTGKCTCGKATCGKSAGKHPAISGWQKAATTDEEQIRKWWAQNPYYNPAVVTGNINGRGRKGEHLVVLDVDGKAGEESLHRLEEEYGPLPPVLTVRTGGGGFHYYFFTTEKISNSVSKLGVHLDIRAKGGYVIAPGSRHLSGRTYEWVEHRGPGSPGLVRELPGWILQKLKERPSVEKAGSVTALEFFYPDGEIPEGTRNEMLFKYGCNLRGTCGKTMQEVAEAVSWMNQNRCKPSLEEAELERIIRQIDQYPRGGDPESDSNEIQPRRLICAADVPDEEASFILKPYLPEGQLTMIQGNPGDGKTAFACKLAAMVSNGGSLMGLPCEDGNVLMLSVEDDQPVLKQRFLASGGDINHYFFVSDASGLSFQSPEIEEFIKEGNIRLVVFDPIQAFIGADVDMNRANETRPVLAALKEMAKRNHCAVVIISHINKGMKDGLAIQRSLGSMDIPGACRSILHIGRLASDTDHRLMVHVKSSNAKEGKSVEFTIAEKGGIHFERFTDKGYEDLSILGRKARNAAKDPMLLADVLSACKMILKKNPKGAKVSYKDLDIPWPAGVRPGVLLDSYREKLEDAGIRIETGQRIKGGASAVMITPYRILDDDPYTENKAPSSPSSPTAGIIHAQGEDSDKGDNNNYQKGIQYGKDFLQLHANVH